MSNPRKDIVSLATKCFAALGVLLILASLGTSASADGDAKPVAGDLPRYEQIKQRDRITHEFVLDHPAGQLPSGLTSSEAEDVASILKAGCERILETQQENGLLRFPSTSEKFSKPDHPGVQALAVWTLIEAGMLPSDSRLKKAIECMIEIAEDRAYMVDDSKGVVSRMTWRHPTGLTIHQTYCASLFIIALHSVAIARVKEAPKPESIDDASEAPSLLNYLSDREKTVVREAWATLLRRQLPSGTWSYQEHSNGDGDGDFSNSHFAMLALLSAKRLGLKSPPKVVLDRAENAWVKAQQADGPLVAMRFREIPESEPDAVRKSGTRRTEYRARGWGYTKTVVSQSSRPPERGGIKVPPPPQHQSVSMTAAGVICLAAIRHLRELDSGVPAKRFAGGNGSPLDQAICDGMAWLSSTLTKEQDAKDGPVGNQAGEPNEDPHHAQRTFPATASTKSPGYTMLAVERAAVLTGSDFFGKCEWYPVGVRAILPRLDHLKKPTPMNSEPVISTGDCMYLLFLKGYLDKAPSGREITGKDRPRG